MKHIQSSLKLIFMVLILRGNAKYAPSWIAMIWSERGVAVCYKCLKNILKLIFEKKKKKRRTLGNSQSQDKYLNAV